MRHNGVKFDVIVGVAIIVITLFCFLLVRIGIIPGRITSSLCIVGILVSIGFLYGWVSIPAIVAGVCFIPSLAFFWAWMNNASYINHMNHWLQDDSFFVNYSIFLSLISLLTTFAFLLFCRKRFLADNVKIERHSTLLSEPLFIGSSLLAAFFFWLAEPGATILTVSYSVLLQQRYEGTQYAAALGLLCWLMSYLTYWSNGQRKTAVRNQFNLGRKIFIIATIFSVFWLLLHARRSELSGMFILLILTVAERKGTKSALIYLSFVLISLITVGRVRSASLMDMFSGGAAHSANTNIASLPGGASNVFMSFIDVVHYFSSHSMLYGKTFVNYLFQILPTNLYGYFDISKPPFFSDSGIFDGYAWNGGINGMSIFYANFGVIGSLLYGILIGGYIVVAIYALRSSQLTIRVMGAYLVAIVLRGFWYEFITIIKPVLFLLLVSVIFYKPQKRDCVAV